MPVPVLAAGLCRASWVDAEPAPLPRWPAQTAQVRGCAAHASPLPSSIPFSLLSQQACYWCRLVCHLASGDLNFGLRPKGRVYFSSEQKSSMNILCSWVCAYTQSWTGHAWCKEGTLHTASKTKKKLLVTFSVITWGTICSSFLLRPEMLSVGLWFGLVFNTGPNPVLTLLGI